MLEIGDYGYYYPVNWANGQPKVNDERWGKKCRIAKIHGYLMFLVFEDNMSGMTYASYTEVSEEEK